MNTTSRIVMSGLIVFAAATACRAQKPDLGSYTDADPAPRTRTEARQTEPARAPLVSATEARPWSPLRPRSGPAGTAARLDHQRLTETAARTSGPRAASEKRWVWLERQGVWGYGYQLTDGPNRGLWRIDPGTKRAPAPPADPHGFTAMLNRLRSAVGLQPVAYDTDLTAWASQNNVAQCSQGLGHHVNPNCYQNSAWNTPDAESTFNTWLNSPGHRENMLAPEITRVGLAHGPGPYWTLNAR